MDESDVNEQLKGLFNVASLGTLFNSLVQTLKQQQRTIADLTEKSERMQAALDDVGALSSALESMTGGLSQRLDEVQTKAEADRQELITAIQSRSPRPTLHVDDEREEEPVAIAAPSAASSAENSTPVIPTQGRSSSSVMEKQLAETKNQMAAMMDAKISQMFGNSALLKELSHKLEDIQDLKSKYDSLNKKVDDSNKENEKFKENTRKSITGVEDSIKGLRAEVKALDKPRPPGAASAAAPPRRADQRRITMAGGISVGSWGDLPSDAQIVTPPDSSRKEDRAFPRSTVPHAAPAAARMTRGLIKASSSTEAEGDDDEQAAAAAGEGPSDGLADQPPNNINVDEVVQQALATIDPEQLIEVATGVAEVVQYAIEESFDMASVTSEVSADVQQHQQQQLFDAEYQLPDEEEQEEAGPSQEQQESVPAEEAEQAGAAAAAAAAESAPQEGAKGSAPQAAAPVTRIIMAQKPPTGRSNSRVDPNAGAAAPFKYDPKRVVTGKIMTPSGAWDSGKLVSEGRKAIIKRTIQDKVNEIDLSTILQNGLENSKCIRILSVLNILFVMDDFLSCRGQD